MQMRVQTQSGAKFIGRTCDTAASDSDQMREQQIQWAHLHPIASENTSIVYILYNNNTIVIMVVQKSPTMQTEKITFDHNHLLVFSSQIKYSSK
jgi:hypothetical protein